MAKKPIPVPPLRTKPSLPFDSEFHPADADLPDFVVASMKAWSRGEASKDQQITAWNFIVNDLCATYDLSYRPDRPEATAFMEGRRFVGLQIRKTIQLKPVARKDHVRPASNRSDGEQPG